MEKMNECKIACYSVFDLNEFHPLLNRVNCYIKAYITGPLAQNIQPNPINHLNPSRTLNQEDGTTPGKESLLKSTRAQICQEGADH